MKGQVICERDQVRLISLFSHASHVWLTEENFSLSYYLGALSSKTRHRQAEITFRCRIAASLSTVLGSRVNLIRESVRIEALLAQLQRGCRLPGAAWIHRFTKHISRYCSTYSSLSLSLSLSLLSSFSLPLSFFIFLSFSLLLFLSFSLFPTLSLPHALSGVQSHHQNCVLALQLFVFSSASFLLPEFSW